MSRSAGGCVLISNPISPSGKHLKGRRASFSAAKIMVFRLDLALVRPFEARFSRIPLLCRGCLGAAMTAAFVPRSFVCFWFTNF